MGVDKMMTKRCDLCQSCWIMSCIYTVCHDDLW